MKMVIYIFFAELCDIFGETTWVARTENVGDIRKKFK